MGNNINICISCDDNYVRYAGVVMASVLYNASESDDLSFYVLDGGISEDSKQKMLSLKTIKDCEINFVSIDESLFEDFKKVTTHKYISIAAYFRLKLPSLLPDIDRIIYFDCDVVINSSLKKLFNTDMENHPIAGVVDIKKKIVKINPGYVNSGVLLLDLKKMRELNIENEFYIYTKDNFETIKCGDQEIINAVCKGDIKILENKWNVQISNFTNRSDYMKNPAIIHYVSKNKPWQFGSYSYRKELFYKYFQLTPWKYDKKEYFMQRYIGEIYSWFRYFKYRPLFMFRPKFWYALYRTYFNFSLYKKPIIKDNTFFVWEPCGKSHAEVVPGFVKYLLDLGYHVSVLVSPNAYKENLFARFGDNKNISYNKMSQKQIRTYFKKSDLSDVEGVIVTTVGKLCTAPHYEQVDEAFNPKIDRKKLFFVEHEIDERVDRNQLPETMITLRQMNYKGAKTVVVNPHYFGEVKITPKNDITNFVTVGELKAGKKNTTVFVNSAQKLIQNGITNFKITVVGKGKIEDLPKEVAPYFDIKGRLPFDRMFEEIENGDFLLSAYEDIPEHFRYITTGTSGNFQLVYGFIKPIIIKENFASINGFDEQNSILYRDDDDFYNAMVKGIQLSKEDYKIMQENLKSYSDNFYNESKENLKNLIETQKGEKI